MKWRVVAKLLNHRIHEKCTVEEQRRAGGYTSHSVRVEDHLSRDLPFPAIFSFISFGDVARSSRARVFKRIRAYAHEARDEK